MALREASGVGVGVVRYVRNGACRDVAEAAITVVTTTGSGEASEACCSK